VAPRSDPPDPGSAAVSPDSPGSRRGCSCSTSVWPSAPARTKRASSSPSGRPLPGTCTRRTPNHALLPHAGSVVDPALLPYQEGAARGSASASYYLGSARPKRLGVHPLAPRGAMAERRKPSVLPPRRRPRFGTGMWRPAARSPGTP
jgi:hypothetical protein